jgi:hypothetical protein
MCYNPIMKILYTFLWSTTRCRAATVLVVFGLGGLIWGLIAHPTVRDSITLVLGVIVIAVVFRDFLADHRRSHN